MSSSGKNKAGIPPRNYGKRRIRYDMLAMWYGHERADVEISAHTSQPEAISGIIDEVLMESRKRNNPGAIAALASRWSEVVGNMFASCCTPVVLKDGTLTVQVRHSALIAELNMSKDLMLKAVNRVSGGICREIIFVSR